MYDIIIWAIGKYWIHYLLSINFFTSLLFIWDKIKGKIINAQRIEESTFHLCSFLGGIFATTFLINILNRKRARMDFQIITYLILAIWIYLLCSNYHILKLPGL